MPEAPLQRYYQKRDFSVTPEPRGRVQHSPSRRRFVIQKHKARRLHYDFRLELEGTLKSWAVPKGPSLDPTVKRMAVEVEDHPLDYASFEGIIPPGEYGAGSVIVWDEGEWEPEEDPVAGYRAGKLKFRLKGEKLDGCWVLVRTRYDGKQRNWLLIKEKDDAARPEGELDIAQAKPNSIISGKPVEEVTAVPLPAAKSPRAGSSKLKQGTGMELPTKARKAPLPDELSPQLATLVETPPRDSNWFYEVKYDGYRIVARLADGRARLVTRNGHDWTRRLPHLARVLGALPVTTAWLDGEIVMPGPDGMPDFQALQSAFDGGSTAAIRYYLFDLPYLNGYDLARVPLRERRRLLEHILARQSDVLAFSESFEAQPDRLLGRACEMRLEGVIGKRPESPYVQRRSADWIKLKCTERQEFVIGGYTDPKGSRQGFGSLLLGYHDSAGQLRYAGKVGTGFTEATLKTVAAELKRLERKTSPFDQGPATSIARTAHWVRPKLVGEVSFLSWTQGGHLRRPVFHGLRSDKPPSVITRERKKPDASSQGHRPRAQGAEVKPGRSTAPAGLKLTHPERIVDQRSGATKADLAHYYDRIADLLLAHLRERPVSLVRSPRGVGGQRFFQKHATAKQIPGLHQLDPTLDPGHDPLVTLDDRRTLLNAAQANVFEFHTWNAVINNIECPDRIIFDLDPGDGVEWARIVDAARLMHGMLKEIGLKGFLKTSGGKGLHVVVPIEPRYSWDAAKGLSHAVVQHLATTLPTLFVEKSGPKNRVGRIFADYLRNGRGATTVSAYSPRLRPGLPISVLLAWKELDTLRSSDQWTIFDVEDLLKRERSNPWRGYGSVRQNLDEAMTILGMART